MKMLYIIRLERIHVQTTATYHHISSIIISLWDQGQSMTTSSAGWNVEQRELLLMESENASLYYTKSHKLWKTVWQFLTKRSIFLPPAIT